MSVGAGANDSLMPFLSEATEEIQSLSFDRQFLWEFGEAHHRSFPATHFVTCARYA
jgi:hypothetical protein